eukprot:8132480-Alexandrium_andersonii.AAC.1
MSRSVALLMRHMQQATELQAATPRMIVEQRFSFRVCGNSPFDVSKMGVAHCLRETSGRKEL